MWRPSPILTLGFFRTDRQPSGDSESEREEREKIKERESFAQQLPAATDTLFTVGSG